MTQRSGFSFVFSNENLIVIFSEIGPKCYVLAVLPLVSAISRENEQVCFSGNLVNFFFSVLFQVFVDFDSVGNDTKVRFAVVLSTENLFVIFSEIGPKCYVLAVLPLVCAISRKNEQVCFSGDLVKIFYSNIYSPYFDAHTSKCPVICFDTNFC